MKGLAVELPARMTCLACFSPTFERRTSKRGGIYYVCPLCTLKIFVNNQVHAYGLLFWAKALADEAVIATARADLERALRRDTAGTEVRPPPAVPGPLPATLPPLSAVAGIPKLEVLR